MIENERFEKVEVAPVDDPRAWLAINHASDDSIWLVTYKKVVPEKRIARRSPRRIAVLWVDRRADAQDRRVI